MDFYQALKDPKAATTIYLFDGLHLTLLAIGRKVPSEVSCFPYWKMCLLPLAQPSGNNISHTERSWCQGQLSCKRRGRWETCIDFSFCWGKQACCSWARVQWGRHNVLDCSSSLSPVSCDCWETPWKQLSQKKSPTKTLSICIFFFPISLNSRQHEMLGVITHLITLFRAKRAGGENLAGDPEMKRSQHHPR